MQDPQNPDLAFYYLVHHTKISDAEFPVALQCLTQWGPIAFRGDDKARLDCASDPTLNIGWKIEDVPLSDVWMVDEGKGHSPTLAFLVGPDLQMA